MTLGWMVSSNAIAIGFQRLMPTLCREIIQKRREPDQWADQLNRRSIKRTRIHECGSSVAIRGRNSTGAPLPTAGAERILVRRNRHRWYQNSLAENTMPCVKTAATAALIPIDLGLSMKPPQFYRLFLAESLVFLWKRYSALCRDNPKSVTCNRFGVQIGRLWCWRRTKSPSNAAQK